MSQRGENVHPFGRSDRRGTVPRLSDLPQGCTFSPRCNIRTGQCEAEPDLVEVKPGHQVRCWNWKTK